MKKLLSVFTVFLFVFLTFGATNQVFALDNCKETYGSKFDVNNFKPNYGPIFIENKSGTVTTQINGLTPGGVYTIKCERKGNFWTWPEHDTFSISANGSGTGSLNISNANCWSQADDYRLKLISGASGSECLAFEYTVVEEADAAYCVAKSAVDSTGRAGCFQKDDQISWNFEVVNGDGTAYANDLMIRTTNVLGGQVGLGRIFSSPDGKISGTDTVAGPDDVIVYSVYAEADISKEIASCTLNLGNADNDVCTEEERNRSSVGSPEKFSLCKQIPIEQMEAREACQKCVGGTLENELNEGVWTAVGCIRRDANSIIQSFISVGLGMAGGVALITFLAAGFIFSTSEGDPKAYGKAKEMMTASIVGLIFVIFSVTILQFIGYSILKIPGFGG